MRPRPIACAVLALLLSSCALAHERSSDAGPPGDVTGLLHVTLTDVAVTTNGLPGTGTTTDRVSAQWRVVVRGGEGPTAELREARLRMGHAPGGIVQTLTVNTTSFPLVSGQGTAAMMKTSGTPPITSAMVGTVCADPQVELTIVLRINGHDFETAVITTNACTR